jgi:type VI secretion system (T6SS) phospholipase Tle1-like effector
VLPKQNLDFCFHAMALDERRPSFLNTRLTGACEVWFRGAHSDVGGGNGNRPLNDIALRWMMRKAIAARLPIDPADVPDPDVTSLEPNHSNTLPVKIRLISAIDRSHYTVTPMEGWTNPPDTCPKESEADERTALQVGDSGIEVQSEDARRRVLVMWETALDVTAASDFKLDPIRDALLTLFEARSPLVTDDEKLQAARAAVRRLITTTIAGARQRGFHVLDEFFLNEALFKMPRVFPLTD